VLPTVNGRRLIRALERAGFVLLRSRGSHQILAHRSDPARRVVVPVHGKRDLKPGTLRAILLRARLTVDEFTKLL
jgi:predicted RNA binding protein YcfA (HicA-like mRNA interferase family)